MDEPARNLANDGQSESDGTDKIRHLESLPGGGEGGEPAHPQASLQAAPTPIYDEPTGVAPSAPPGRHLRSVPGPKDLNDVEQSAGGGAAGGLAGAKQAVPTGDQSENSWYKPSLAKLKPGSKIWLFNKRRAAFGGGIIGTIIGLIAFFTFTAGPFEIVHIAQLLEKAHFSHQDNAGDDRMGRMFRYFRTGDVGETRLTFLESKYKNRILGQMKDIGLTPQYDSVTGYIKSFTIDASDPGSPYHGMSNEEVQAALSEKYGAKVNVDQINGLKSKFRVQADGLFGAAQTNRLMAKETGNSTIVTAIRSRVMGKYGYATWHPLKIADRALNQKVADAYKAWSVARNEKLKAGVNASTIDGTNAQEEGNNGSKIPEPSAEAPLTSDKVTSTLKAIQGSKSLKVAGGIAAGVGIVCAVNTVRNNMGDIRQAQVIAPLIRMGMEVITVGSQAQTGQDIDSTIMSFEAKNFTGTDAKGKTTSWDQATPFQAREGNAGGIDIDPSTKDLITAGTPAWISWTDTPTVTALCSNTGQYISGTVSAVVGIVSGGVISTVGGIVAGAVGGPLVIDKLSHLLAGGAVDVAVSGAQWGNDIDYGTRLAGNAMSLMFGGVALNNGQVGQLDSNENSIDQADFQSQSIAHRLFSPSDERSAISKLIDKTSPSFSQNVSNLGAAFLNFSHMFGSISSIFSPKAAAVGVPYDYGFPEYGFSDADLNNPAVANPYANAEDVAKLLDSPSGTAYIAKAGKCFGVGITKTGSQGWDVIPDGTPVNPYHSKYPSDCTSSGDVNWLKIRFFIMDTGVMEGYACYQGDDISCANDGVNSGSGQDNTSSGITSTAGATIDMSTLYDDSTSVACAPGTNDLGIQDGYTGGQKVEIRICAVPGLPSSGQESNGGFGVSGANGLAVVNSRVSGAVLAMVKAAAAGGVNLTAISSFRSMTHQESLCPCDGVNVGKPGYSNHQLGLAIDFGGGLPSSSGPVPGNAFWNWLTQNASKFGYKNYYKEAWHWSPSGN